MSAAAASETMMNATITRALRKSMSLVFSSAVRRPASWAPYLPTTSGPARSQLA
jgi:hypothetical protein